MRQNMNMRSLRLLLLVFVAGLVMASCDDDKNSGSSTEVVNYNLTLVASDPCEISSPLTEDWTWHTGDEMAFLNLTYSRNVSKLTYNGASYTGSVPSVSSSAKMGFFYPASAVNQMSSDTSYVKVDFTQQDGVNAPVYLAGTTTATINGTNAEAKLNMHIVNAIANMKFLYEGNPIENITNVEVYSDREVMYNRGDYEMKTLSYNSLGTGNITVTNTGLNGAARIGLIPCSGVRLGVSVITADGVVYTATQEKSFNIVAGEEYSITYDCEKFESKAKIGDYFYSDYTYSTQYDETKQCVGVVMALTDRRGGDINRNLTSGVHGRVVALTDTYRYAWAFNGTKVYDMPKLTNYENADGTNASGYLPFYSSNGSIGYYEEADVKIPAAIDRLGNITSWPSSGALSDFNGLRNTESVDSASNKYPAGYYASHYNVGGITSWYMPSAGEMALVYALYNSGVISNQTGLVGLREFGYWTSTENSREKVWVMQAFDGKVYANFKTSIYYVRPILAF